MPQSQEAFSQSAGFLDINQVAGQTAFPILVNSPTGTNLFWITTTGEIFTNEDVFFMSGTGFEGQLAHTITTDRVWTFPDATGTVLLNDNVATVTSKTFGTGNLISTGFAYTDGIKQLFNPDNTNAGINIGANALEPTSPIAGDLFFDSTALQLKGYDGTSWLNLGGAGGSASQIIVADTSLSVIDTGADGRLEFLPDGATDAGDTTGALNLVNAGQLCWEASPTGTDVCILVDASENFVYTTDINQINLNSNPVTGFVAGADVDMGTNDITNTGQLQFDTSTLIRRGATTMFLDVAEFGAVTIEHNLVNTYVFSASALNLIGVDLDMGTGTLEFITAQQSIQGNLLDLQYDVDASGFHVWRVNNVDEMTLSNTILSLQNNNIRDVSFLSFADTNLSIQAISSDLVYDVDTTQSHDFRIADVVELTLDATNGLQLATRLNQDKGADVVATAILTLDNDGNTFDITGATTINEVLATDWQNGAVIHLQFDGAPQVTHNSGGTNDILLGDQANFATSAGDVLSLFFDGTDWQEISRSVVGASSSSISAGDSSATIIDTGVDGQLGLIFDGGDPSDTAGAINLANANQICWESDPAGADLCIQGTIGENFQFQSDWVNIDFNANPVANMALADSLDLNGQFISMSGDPADIGILRVTNAQDAVCWESSPTGADICLQVDANEDFIFDTDLNQINLNDNPVAGLTLADSLAGNGQNIDAINDITYQGRALWDKGTDEASATELTLATDGNQFDITGAVTIDTISPTGWLDGAVIHLKFDGAPQVTHNSGGVNDILLGNQANFATTAGDVLSLFFDGTDWQEISRSVVGAGAEVFTWTADHATGGNSFTLTDDTTPPAGSVIAIYAENGELTYNVATGDSHLWRTNDVAEMALDVASLDIGTKGLQFGIDAVSQAGVVTFINWDDTNMQFNVPTGDGFSFDVNAVPEVAIQTDGDLDLFQNRIDFSTDGHTITPSASQLVINTGGASDNIILSTLGTTRLAITNNLVQFNGVDLDVLGNEILNVGGADGGEATAIGIANAGTICWEADPTGTDQCIQVDASEQFIFSTTITNIDFNSNPLIDVTLGASLDANSQNINNVQTFRMDGDPADDVDAINLANADSICWEASPTGTDFCISGDANEDILFDTNINNINLNSNPLTNVVAGGLFDMVNNVIDNVQFINFDGDIADAGQIRFANNQAIAWESSPPSTAEPSISVDANENLLFNDPDINAINFGVNPFINRIQWDKGADEPSASELTLATDGNTFDVTGAVAINTISPTDWSDGSIITLHFISNPVVNHNSGGTNDILLGDQANFATSAGDVLTLYFDGTDWREISRSVVGGAGASDIITEADSNVEVIDAGTGQVDIDIDGANEFIFTTDQLDVLGADIVNIAVLTMSGDSADGSVSGINLKDSENICWEASPAGTDACITMANEEFTFLSGVANVDFTNALLANAGLADSLDANSQDILNVNDLEMEGRMKWDKGADIVGIDATALGADGNFFDITGSTTINHILNTNWQIGSVIGLHFDSTPTITHNAGGLTGDETNLLLIDSANHVATAGDTKFFLLHDATTFIEIARNEDKDSGGSPSQIVVADTTFSVVDAGADGRIEFLPNGATDPADTTDAINLANADSICWESDPTGTDNCLSVESNEEFSFRVGGGSDFTIHDDQIDFEGNPQINVGTIARAGDPADIGALRLLNTDQICWEASPTGTEFCIAGDASENIIFETDINNINLNSNPVTGFVAGADIAMGSFDINAVTDITFEGRQKLDKGADIASASVLTLGGDGNVFDITGSNPVNQILATNWQIGSIVTLHFDNDLTIAHNSGGSNDFDLQGAINYAVTNGDTLTVFLNSASDWQEISRSAGIETFTWSADHTTSGNSMVLTDDTTPPASGVASFYLENGEMNWNVSTGNAFQWRSNSAIVVDIDDIGMNIGTRALEFGIDTVDPASTVAFINFDDVQMRLNVPTGDIHSFDIAGTPEVTISATNADFTSLNIINVNDLELEGREKLDKATDVVATTDMVLTTDGNVFDITGATTIDHIANTNWQIGSVIYLHFVGAPILTHASGAEVGDEASLFLVGDANHATVAGDIKAFVLLEATQWQEIARNTDDDSGGTPSQIIVGDSSATIIDTGTDGQLGLSFDGSDPSDTAGALNFANSNEICWESNPAGTDICFGLTAGEDLQFDTTFNTINFNTVPLFNVEFIDDAGADSADAGFLRLSNTAEITWESDPTGADISIQMDANEDFLFATGFNEINFNSNPLSNAVLANNLVAGSNAITGLLSLTFDGDIADSGEIRFANLDDICWEQAPAGAEICISVDANEDLLFSDADINAIDFGVNPFINRIQWDKGADEASASELTLATDGNTFDVTGVIAINTISPTDWSDGAIITLHFISNPIVNHNSGGTNDILLGNQANFATTAGDVLMLYFDGTDWREISRSVVGAGGEVFTWTADHDTGGFSLFLTDDATPPAGTQTAIYAEAGELNFNVASTNAHQWRINDVVVADLDLGDFTTHNMDITIDTGNLQMSSGTTIFWGASADRRIANSGTGFIFEIETSDTYLYQILGNPEMTLSATQMDFHGNEIINLAGADGGEATAIGIANAGTICWEASPTGTDFCISGDASENIVFGTNINEINLNDNPVQGLTLADSLAGNGQNIDAINDITYQGREKLDKATDVVATTDMVLTTDGNVFDITGATTIDHIANTNWQIGSVIYLHFVGAPILTHASGAEVGDEASLFLVGDANHATVAGDVKAFVLLEATQWQEIARNTDDDSGGTPTQIVAGDSDMTIVDTGIGLIRIEFDGQSASNAGGALNFANADQICWEQDPASADLCVVADATENFVFNANWNNLDFGSNPITNFVAGGTVDLATNLIDNVGDIATGTISDETNTVNSIVITDTTGLMTIGAGINFASQALTGIDVVCDEATSSCVGVSAITGLGVQIQTLDLGDFEYTAHSVGATDFLEIENIIVEAEDTGTVPVMQFTVSDDAPSAIINRDLFAFTNNGVVQIVITNDGNLDIGNQEILGNLGMSIEWNADTNHHITGIGGAIEYAVPSGAGHLWRVNTAIMTNLLENQGWVHDVRVNWDKGADEPSASELTLATDGNTFDVTGAVAINTILATDWSDGAIITLHFISNPVVNHNSGGTNDILLGDQANFSTTAGDVLMLYFDGTDWREISRSVVGGAGGASISAGDSSATIIDTGTDGQLGLIFDGSDPSDTALALNLANANFICWEASPVGTDLCINADASENFVFDTNWVNIDLNSNPVTNFIAGGTINVNNNVLQLGNAGTETISMQGDSMIFDVFTANFFSFDVNTAPEYQFDSSRADFLGNEIINLGGADGGEATALGIANAGTICWEASPTGTDFCISGDANEDILFGTNINNINFNSNPITNFIAGGTVDLATNLIDNVSDIATGTISDETNTVDSIIITDTTGALDFTSKAIAGFDIDCDEATSSCANVDTGDFIGVAEPKHAILTAGGATLQVSATPTRQTITGTNFDYIVLDFADGVDTDVIWNWEVPDNFDSTANIVVEIRYLNTVFTNEIRWDGEFRGIADAGTFDGAFEGTAQVVDDTAVASGILNTVTMTFTSANHALNAGEVAIFHLERTGTNVADDNTGIGRLIDVKVEWS